MKKFLFPLWIILAWLLYFIVGVWIGEEIPSDVGYGGLAYILIMLTLMILFIIPIYCILYSRRVLLREKWKWLFVPYNAVWVTLPYMPLLFVEEETLVFGAILFAWGALWTAVPLLFPARKKPSDLAS